MKLKFPTMRYSFKTKPALLTHVRVDIYHRNINVHRNIKFVVITVDCLHSRQGIESHHEINVLTLEYRIYRGKYTNIEHD